MKKRDLKMQSWESPAFIFRGEIHWDRGERAGSMAVVYTFLIHQMWVEKGYSLNSIAHEKFKQRLSRCCDYSVFGTNHGIEK